KLKRQSGIVGGGSTGTWTLQTAKGLNLKAPMLQGAMNARKKSVKRPDFSTRVVAALRYEFGGHEAPKK
ncbi:MAG: 6-phosphogluconate dehydrogenase (decarboxylating), partial [archaeon]